jgi:hypothetical protein
MPADRLTHPRIGRSRKVTLLNDFEFRVWDTYRWAADDFGVMPKSAAKLRGENDALRNQHTDFEVAEALDKMIEIELLAEFDHQGAQYVCSLTWQTHQKITHPRQTHYPAPTPEVFEDMDVETRKFFRNFHESFRKVSPSRARASRETANGKRLTANGSGGESERGIVHQRFERFWAEYPRKVGKDAALGLFLRLKPDNDLTDRMIAQVRQQRASEQWRREEGRFIPHPKTWLSQGRWKDESEGPSTSREPYHHAACPHDPKCGSARGCADLKAAARRVPA